MHPRATHHCCLVGRRRSLSRRFARSLAARSLAAVLLAGAVGLSVGAGCSSKKELPAPVQRYQALPDKQVPDFLKGTILERTDLANTEPLLLSGYGVVANLDGTGDSRAPNRVRDYIVKEMVKHGFGSSTLPGMKELTPERVLSDPRFAIVEVHGYMPAGIRERQHFDVQVSALPDNDTRSLARGDLYQTDLRILGANPMDPGGSVNVYGKAQGSVYVNPAYAFERNASDPAALRSLRRGVVMDGGYAMIDRPLHLRLRRPQFSMSRRIEQRLEERFQEMKFEDEVAAAQDEGIVAVYVPRSGPYAGDWQRFAGVVLHTYLDGSSAFAARKARELAEEAVKPGALLEDISLCWEALGSESLPVVQELMTHPQPDVAYAAARAAAFLNDAGAPQALAEMARTPDHPFRLNAIRTLGALPSSPVINSMLRPLLNVPEATVRVEAYKVLADRRDPSLLSATIQEKFVLDIVRSSGPPIIYATQRGIPRIAIIGERPRLATPVLFTAMENRLSMSSMPAAAAADAGAADAGAAGGGAEAEAAAGAGAAGGGLVTIFYRGSDVRKPVAVASTADLAEIVARLAGEGAPRGRGLNFNYSEIVAILGALTEQQKVVASTGPPAGPGDDAAAAVSAVPASLVLQELPQVQEEIFSAPPLDAARPQGNDDAAGPVGMAQ